MCKKLDEAIFHTENIVSKKKSGPTWADVTLTATYPNGGGPSSIRGDTLDYVKGLITNDRNNQYGPPHQDFMRVAKMASAWGFRFLNPKTGEYEELDGWMTAIFVKFVKLSRLSWDQKDDNWDDDIGYAACGKEAYKLEHPEGDK